MIATDLRDVKFRAIDPAGVVDLLLQHLKRHGTGAAPFREWPAAGDDGAQQDLASSPLGKSRACSRALSALLRRAPDACRVPVRSKFEIGRFAVSQLKSFVYYVIYE
jgi:hypothetical protein